MSTISLQSIRDAIMVVDTAVFRAINLGLGTRVLDPVMVFFTTLGLGEVQAAVGFVVLLIGAFRRRVDLRRMGYAAIATYAGSGFLSQVAKHLTDRPRPPLVLPDVRLVVQPLFVHSFPSGHTMTAFAAAFVWAAFLPRWRWFFYVAAGLVGISRIYVGVHFPFDVLYGAIWGSLVGLTAARIFRPKAEQSTSAKLTAEEAE